MLEKLKDFDKHFNILDYVIKNENLENDFFDFLEKVKVKIDKNKKDDMKKLDKSSKTLKKNSLDYYYDKESIESKLRYGGDAERMLFPHLVSVDSSYS